MRQALLDRLMASTRAAREQKKTARGFRPTPCRHLGQPTGERVPCQSCGQGTLMVPLHQCQLHGKCSERNLISGTPCCKICPDKDTR